MWHAGYGSNVFFDRAAREFFDLGLPFIHQCNAKFRCPDPVRPNGVFCNNTALRIAILCVIVHGVDRLTSPNHQAFAGQQFRIWFELIIDRQYVF